MKIDEQWECWTLCAIKIEGTYRGGKGTTPVTTSCPEDRRVEEVKSKSHDEKKRKKKETVFVDALCRTSMESETCDISWILTYVWYHKYLWTKAQWAGWDVVCHKLEKPQATSLCLVSQSKFHDCLLKEGVASMADYCWKIVLLSLRIR